jgi:hypothetical protein
MRPILLAPALAVVFCSVAWAQGTDEQRAACADDYRIHCSYIPPDDPGRILACFREHRKDLSDACRKIIDAAKKEK